MLSNPFLIWYIVCPILCAICLSLAHTNIEHTMWFFWILRLRAWHFSSPVNCLSSLWNSSIFQRMAHSSRVSSAEFWVMSFVATCSVRLVEICTWNNLTLCSAGKPLTLTILPSFNSSSLQLSSSICLYFSTPLLSSTLRFFLEPV